MKYSDELVSAFKKLQAGYNRGPREVWLAWIDVPENIGQDMITLLNSIIDRALIREKDKIPIGNYRAYLDLASIANKSPWIDSGK